MVNPIGILSSMEASRFFGQVKFSCLEYAQRFAIHIFSWYIFHSQRLGFLLYIFVGSCRALLSLFIGILRRFFVVKQCVINQIAKICLFGIRIGFSVEMYSMDIYSMTSGELQVAYETGKITLEEMKGGFSSKSRWTLLHIAAAKGDQNEVEILLQNGFDRDPLNLDEETPLHLSIDCGHSGVAEILIAAGANCNAANRISDSCLCKAARKNDVKILLLLLKGGASINQAGRYGRTPLHEASMHGNIDAVRFLLSWGAEKLKTDNFNKTAFDYASEKNHIDVVRAIRALRNGNVCLEITRSQLALYAFLTFVLFSCKYCLR